MLRNNGGAKSKRLAKTDKKQSPQHKQSKKQLSTKKSKLPSSLTKLSTSTAFRKSKPLRGIWDTPQDQPGSNPEKYVDFYKDTPVNSLAGQLIRDMRDFVLIQTGSPQFFDRDYEQQKIMGEEGFKAYKKQMADNNYGAFQDYAELDFDTSYYKRINLKPVHSVNEVPLRLDPNLSDFRESPAHFQPAFNFKNEAYLLHNEHVISKTGIPPGLDYVDVTRFQFPDMSIDNDYLFFHD